MFNFLKILIPHRDRNVVNARIHRQVVRIFIIDNMNKNLIYFYLLNQKKQAQPKIFIYIWFLIEDDYIVPTALNMLRWWNWYTCTLEVRMPYGLRVRVPSSAVTQLTNTLGNRLKVGHRTLTPFVQVRILVPQN